jgi:hypothetical protein
VRVDQFYRRNFLAAKLFQRFGDGGIKGVGHGLRKQGNVAIAIGQGGLEAASGKPL